MTDINDWDCSPFESFGCPGAQADAELQESGAGHREVQLEALLLVRRIPGLA